LTCPQPVPRIIDVMDTTDYANQIVNKLEAKGYSKDMIIGFLQGTISSLKYMENKTISNYLSKVVKDIQP
jgi:hypothetical protein